MTRCERCGAQVSPGSRYCGSCGRQVADPAASTLMMGEEEDGLIVEVRRALVGEYDIEREVGRGAMAVVYRATEAGLHRRVALKVLPPEMALSRALAERFKREARLAASLEHPNIIPVYREGQAGRFLFMTMKFVDGRPLDAIIESQGPLPVSVVLHTLRAATSALAYAHERGIVHRDVKSANILIDREGKVLVSDFGIARATEDASLTSTGTMIGTPYFMSPEQCAARRIGPQSDQYSLGVVAFQMLTALVPFHAETLPGIMHHHFYTPVPDITAARKDVPAALLTVIERALSKKPEHRFASTQAMLEAVEAIAFSDQEKRDGLAYLRDLAHGAPIPVVRTATLPALPSSVRLTPPSGPALAIGAGASSGERRIQRWWPAAAGITAVVAAVAIAMSARPPAARANAPRDAMTLATASPVAGAPAPLEARSEARGTDSARSSPARESSRMTPAPPAIPKTGRLRVRAFPADASIAVDGRVLGSGVVVDSVLPAGGRKLRISAPGYRSYDTTFVIQADEITQLPRINLEPLERQP